jgi:NAD(P)-dependent dehydrogenase (short-subunit alcohol dehydrogenase family)
MAQPDQQIALVTGASRGLGAAVAEQLAASGYHVIAAARTTGALEELDDRIQAAGGSTTLAPFDITDDEAIKRMCISVHERWGGLNLWVHCAVHAAPLAPAAHIADKDWDKSIAINITAAGRLIANLESLLLAKSGTAVYVDDPMDGRKFFGAYGTSKAAQRALFESWANEGMKTGPTVLTFTPNPMPTACRARFYPGEDREPLFEPREEAKRLIKQL